jgi:hypothetical protein
VGDNEREKDTDILLTLEKIDKRVSAQTLVMTMLLTHILTKNCTRNEEARIHKFLEGELGKIMDIANEEGR